MCAWAGEGQRRRENLKQTDEWMHGPTWGSVPWPWDHDLNWNQESDAYLTVQPRYFSWIFFYSWSLNLKLPFLTQPSTSTHYWLDFPSLFPLWNSSLSENILFVYKFTYSTIILESKDPVCSYITISLAPRIVSNT